MMTTQVNPRLITLLKFLIQAASVVMVLIGGLVVIGWSFDFAALKDILTGLTTMKPNTISAAE